MKKLFCLITVFSILLCYSLPAYAESRFDSSYLDFDKLSAYHITEDKLTVGFYTFINNNLDKNIFLVPWIEGDVYGVSAIATNYNMGYWINGTATSSVDPLYHRIRLLKSTSSGSTDSFTAPTYKIWFNSDNTWSQSNIDYMTMIYVNIESYPTNFLLLSAGGECVSTDFCYVESDDYDEGSVHITGLTGFFRNITNSINEQKNAISNLPTTILDGLKRLFIPDSDNMVSTITDFSDYMELTFGYGELTDALRGLVASELENQTSVGSADIQENLNYSLGGSNNIDLQFSLPFSDFYTENLKVRVGGFLKGIFYILLIFYNLDEIYKLIRGRKLFNPTRSSDSSSGLRNDSVISPTYSLPSTPLLNDRNDWEPSWRWVD